MNDRVKRLINFRMDRYQELEIKLGDMAASGLVLEKCGTWLWTFRKEEPKRLTYTVTYFAEASEFNSEMTDNQQTYMDYAKAAGWSFVTQLNQMQIFCTEDENPVPFETDARGKLDNIKRCLRKSFLPSVTVMILVCLLSLFTSSSSFRSDPVDFLSNANMLCSVSVVIACALYFICTLTDYLLWCKRSEKSIAACGECAKRVGVVNKVIDMVFLCFVLGALGVFLLSTASDSNWVTLAVTVLQMPILIIVFRSSINYLKKKKASAMANRIISSIVLLAVSFGYMALIVWAIIGLDMGTSGRSDYRTVSWKITDSQTHDYKLYSDEIPLTCEALYGPIEYDYYSYEAQVDSTPFVTRSSYRQASLPARDSPPSLDYEVIETRLGWLYGMAREQLLEMPPWREDWSYRPIDNELFGTVEAYQRYLEENPSGTYVLLYEDKIITLGMEAAATPAQVEVIREQLQL